MNEKTTNDDTPQDGKNNPAENTSPGDLPPGLSSILSEDSEQIVNRHHHWTKAITRAVEALLYQKESSIVILAGPTGVGKTTALRTIVRRIIREKASELRDPAILPVGYAEVPMSGDRRTRWRDTLRDVLHSLHAQLRARRLKPDKHAIKVTPADQAFFDLEATIIARRPYVIILDEYHNLVWGKGDEAEEAALVRLRSLANRSGCKFLLVGTVKVLRGLDSNPETGRRTELVAFERYRANDAADLDSFKEVVEVFERDLGDRLKFRPSTDLAYAYHSCAGCVGILADWFAAAAARARNNPDGITKKVLDEARKDGAKLAQFDQDARAFEHYLDMLKLKGAALRSEIEAQIAKARSEQK